MATSIIKADAAYRTGTSIGTQDCSIFRTMAAKDGFYGIIHFNKDFTGKTVSVASAATYGTWYSDGKSHTLDLENVTVLEVHEMNVLIKIPADNITSDGIAFIRMQITLSVS